VRSRCDLGRVRREGVGGEVIYTTRDRAEGGEEEEGRAANMV
jgi:hypothetical protein